MNLLKKLNKCKGILTEIFIMPNEAQLM